MFFNFKLKDSVQYIYKKNTETNAYMVEILLDNYDELFNGWDASPLKMKSLEPELFAFLHEAGYEIPLREKLELHFYLSEGFRDLDKEAISSQTIRNNFRMQISFVNRAIRHNTRKILIYILISVIFLFFAYLIPAYAEIEILISLLMEGLIIGGWVLLWEAFRLFFFDYYELSSKRRRFQRFKDSVIRFVYR